MKQLVLGIGSPFAGDKAGWLVAEELAQCLECKETQMEVKTADRPGLELIGLMQPYDSVTLIDALASRKNIGGLRWLSIDTLLAEVNGLSSHQAGVAEALKLASILGHLPHELMLFGLEVSPDQEPSSDMVSVWVEALLTHFAQKPQCYYC